MNDEAVFQGDYCDLRFVKSRKVAVIHIEMPIEAAAAFVAAFGTPQPDKTVPVVVARLNPNAVEERKGGRLAQRAGIICGQAAFHRYVEYRAGDPAGSVGKSEAESYVRRFCEVKSRAELDHDEVKAARFLDLESSYKAWMTVAA